MWHSLLAKPVALRILEYLSTVQEGGTGRQIAGAVHYSPQAVLDALKFLEIPVLVQSRPIGRAKWYSLNRGHWLLKEGLFPLWEKMDDWLYEVGRYYRACLRKKPASIIAYGSVVKGGAKFGSDLDLLFLYQKTTFKELDSILELDEAVYQRFGIRPSCKLETVKNFGRQISKKEGLMRNIFREGKAICGLSIVELLQ